MLVDARSWRRDWRCYGYGCEVRSMSDTVSLILLVMVRGISTYALQQDLDDEK